jgi:hypothetical protein
VRALLLAAAILATAVSAGAVDPYPAGWTPTTVSEFGGLNLLNDSTAIGNDAQKAQNVITDNGYLEKRPGNEILGTILPGYPVKYVTDWVSPQGTRFLIAHASNTVYETDFSAAPVALSAAQPLFNITSVPAFARIYFADGYRAPWFWNGTTTGTVVSASGTAAPICTYLAYKDSRIYCANIPNEGTSRVRVSSTGGAGYWVVPPDVASVDNAPSVFDFTPDDGDSIKCMQTTPWGMFVGKQYSSWMIKGTGNLSYELRILDPKVGCKDNRSVQMVYGVLEWLSNDGVYAYDGSGPPRLISRELDPLIANLPYTSYGTKFWLNNVQADWEAGNLTASGPGAPLSSTISPGSVVSSQTFFVDNTTTTFATGTMVNVSTRETNTLAMSVTTNTVYGGMVTPSSAAWNVVGSDYCSADFYYVGIGTNGVSEHGCSGNVIVRCPLNATNCIYTYGYNSGGSNFTNAMAIVKDGTTGSTLASLVIGKNSSANNPIQFISLSTSVYICFFPSDQIIPAIMPANCSNSPIPSIRQAMATPQGFSIVIDVDWYNNLHTISNIRISSYAPSGSYISSTFDASFSTPTMGVANISLSSNSIAAITLQQETSSDGTNWSAPTTLTQGSVATGGSRYWRYLQNFTTTSGTQTATSSGINSLTAATTGYYNSAVHFIGNKITSYGILTVTQATPNGSTVTYSVRATTYSFNDVSGINLPWTTVTANQIPGIAVSTPTYFQYRSLLDFNNADLSPSIDRIQVNWNEGSGNPVSSGVFDRRYHLCLTLSATSLYPDTCLIRQKNGKWVTWTGPSVGAMGNYNYTLVAADGTSSSKIWTVMSPGVYSDDGAAIDSQWVSDDFTNGVIFNSKVLHEFWVDATPVKSSSVTISYQMDKNASFHDYQFTLDNGSAIDTTIRPVGMVQSGSLNKFIPITSGYDIGRYTRVKFSDLLNNNYWRVNGYLMFMENQGRMIP